MEKNSKNFVVNNNGYIGVLRIDGNNVIVDNENVNNDLFYYRTIKNKEKLKELVDLVRDAIDRDAEFRIKKADLLDEINKDTLESELEKTGFPINYCVSYGYVREIMKKPINYPIIPEELY